MVLTEADKEVRDKFVGVGATDRATGVAGMLSFSAHKFLPADDTKFEPHDADSDAGTPADSDFSYEAHLARHDNHRAALDDCPDDAARIERLEAMSRSAMLAASELRNPGTTCAGSRSRVAFGAHSVIRFVR